MTRDQIQSRAMLRSPHPRYGHLTAGKYEVLHLLGNRMLTSETPQPSDIGMAWVVCMLGPTSPEVQRALSEGAGVLDEVWREELHVSEIAPFVTWFNEQWAEVDAAATTEKKDPKAGKGSRG